MGATDRDIAQAKDFIAPPGYQRHRPETTLLYQLVAEHYPAFRDRRAAEDRPLPRYVEDEFEEPEDTLDPESSPAVKLIKLITSPSRRGSIGGLVTCAKSCLK